MILSSALEARPAMIEIAPWIGVLTFSAEMPGSSSLKDRRQVVRSLSDSLRRRFNASVADLGPDGVHARADLAAVCASSSRGEAERRTGQMREFVERSEENGEFVAAAVSCEVFRYGDVQDREAQ